jgi:hypothetical protein
MFICSTVHLFICSSVHLFICSSVHLFICSSVHLFICSSVHLFICSSICLFLCSSVDPNLFLHISFSLVEVSLHVQFHLLGLPRIGRFLVGDKSKTTFHRFNGFLSLQLKLRLELGFQLRLTKNHQ